MSKRRLRRCKTLWGKKTTQLSHHRRILLDSHSQTETRLPPHSCSHTEIFPGQTKKRQVFSSPLPSGSARSHPPTPGLQFPLLHTQIGEPELHRWLVGLPERRRKKADSQCQHFERAKPRIEEQTRSDLEKAKARDERLLFRSSSTREEKGRNQNYAGRTGYSQLPRYLTGWKRVTQANNRNNNNNNNYPLKSRSEFETSILRISSR